jgi:hypothetical protein
MSWNFNYRGNFQNSSFQVRYHNGQGQEEFHQEEFHQEDNPVQNLLGRILLETFSDVMSRAVRNLSYEIESNVMRDIQRQNRQNREPQFVVIRYKNIPNKKEDKTCPICFDDYDDNSMVLKTECMHHFHEECLKKWIERNKTCPICRTDI